ncbi:tRNA guanosine(34) transglycosylase Tgt [Leptospira ilyithenensis]|uniref:Queuine tRNA-ribosyltransferase n=1 Tax=Leptospira ilyithenensis TaxID=2484901 RepID=A0A4R9LN87_9LEPT|nr:tRNA guanosine(34) transglycosylase Tgt [Leptospira ilyithenensis]TGN08119.1 tRNA guanosine(34) transglycosylase Tgt [Leptospira ilyithenensis]
MSRLNFILEAEAPGTKARAGRFTTLHGEVSTPIFMPVGTQATVKAQNVETLKSVGSRVLLANTYHLLLRPGAEVFRKLGGIHRFMNWDGPVLTDSGGFQIFSLPNARKMTEEGAVFRSYVDGQNVMLSPEISIEMQKAIGSDIMMVLDECVPSTVEHWEAKRAMEVTHRWAKRSLNARGDSLQSMFGIVQGACFEDLRKQSAEVLTQLPFDGFAIGGLAVGETKEERNDFCELSASFLPKNLPRYLMGVGTPLDLLEAVHRGVDMFDCTIPTELAQRGVAFTSIGKLQLHRAVYKFEDSVLDENCDCICCKDYSKAYLHHLIKSDEVLGWQLLAIHNLYFYHRLMSEMRSSIFNGKFLSYYTEKKDSLSQSDNVNPSHHILKPSKAVRKRSLGDYEIIENEEKGYWSVRQKSSGEVMHSVNSPVEEAKKLYIDQSNLRQRISSDSSDPEKSAFLYNDETDPIVIWDVGLGAATNAMAALGCFEELANPKPMRLISFESDLDPLRLALKNNGRFPHLFHKAPKEVLEKSFWKSDSENFTWKLVLGDFATTFSREESPDVVFYDPFSFKTDSILWKPEFFSMLFSYFQTREKTVSLYTYSAATGVRAALLSVGFWVGRGVGSGPKSETTIAYSKCPEGIEEKEGLLGKEWLGRWERSDARYPAELSNENKADWDNRILIHPQFHKDLYL